MQSTDIPLKLPIAWGSSAGGGFIRAIPVNSQIGITDGAASLHDGFVPLNATPIASGGVPPDIKDMNGILYEMSSWDRWYSAGGPVFYDGAFQAAIGGYPKGACVQSGVTLGLMWLSTAENNVTNPDAAGAGWTPLLPVPATLSDLITGTDTVKYATPAALAGLRASTAQILAGVDVARYLTPAAFYGARALAADVLAGTDDHKYLTPYAFAQALGGGGNSITIGPYTFKWGTDRNFHPGEGGVQVYYPVPFPTQTLAVISTNFLPTPGDVDSDMWAHVSLRTKDYFWFNYGAASGGNNGYGFDWFAIGN